MRCLLTYACVAASYCSHSTCSATNPHRALSSPCARTAWRVGDQLNHSAAYLRDCQREAVNVRMAASASKDCIRIGAFARRAHTHDRPHGGREQGGKEEESRVDGDSRGRWRSVPPCVVCSVPLSALCGHHGSRNSEGAGSST